MLAARFGGLVSFSNPIIVPTKPPAQFIAATGHKKGSDIIEALNHADAELGILF